MQENDIRFSTVSISPRDAATDPSAKAYLDALARPDANERTSQLAPNGKRSNLTNALYHLVRTKRFKDWFGDWDNYVLGTATESECKAAVKNWRDARKEFRNKANGRVAELKSDWTKLFSSEAKGESDNFEAHYAAIMALDRLFENSVKMWGEKPRNSSQDISEYTKYGHPFVFNGDVYLAKMTVKEYAHHVGIKDGFYSIEAVSVEKINATGNNGDISVKGRILDRDVGDIIAKRISKCKRVSKVVDENGEPLIVWHGAKNKHNVYNQVHTFHISNREVAHEYGDVVDGNFVNAKNIIEIDADGGEWLSVETPKELIGKFNDGEEIDDGRGFTATFDEYSMSVRDIATFAKRAGYDGVIVRNVEDTNDGTGKLGTDIVTFESTQIKSADPVTYNDAGNVVPLSQRFDADNADIRHSVIRAPHRSTPNGMAGGAEAFARYAGDYRQLAWGLKLGNHNAMIKAAYLMSLMIPDNAVIVPMPNHEGKAIRTGLLAHYILGEKPNADVVYALESEPHESSHHQKKVNRGKVKKITMRRTSAEIPENRPVVVIDNVYASGETWRAAEKELPQANLIVLADASRHSVRISKKEYAQVASEVTRKVAAFKGKDIPSAIVVNNEDAYFICDLFDDGYDFSVSVRLPIDEYNGIIVSKIKERNENRINSTSALADRYANGLQDRASRSGGDNPVPQVDSRAAEYGELSRRLSGGTQDTSFEDASAERLRRDYGNLPPRTGQDENSVTFAPVDELPFAPKNKPVSRHSVSSSRSTNKRTLVAAILAQRQLLWEQKSRAIACALVIIMLV